MYRIVPGVGLTDIFRLGGTFVMCFFRNVLACVLLSGAGPLAAAVVYDEGSQGDLSGDPNAPTAIAVEVGSNLIMGTVVGGAAADQDFFRFTVPVGTVLSGLVVSSFEGDDQGFIGIATGVAFPSPFGAADLIGFELAGTNALGVDLLADSSTTLDGPLGSGDYAALIQETSTTLNTYTFDFQVQAVPVPMAVYLFLSGIACLWTLGRRRS